MLKQIEIYGFKSFAEKTIISLEDDINGIVGPNGSGKSNIVDAIKWCLGEQSLKEIRAKNPVDVIFAGSESKPPLNYCEVTITFDNQKRIFPIDYEEISVTRKIYRSGETEYFINRTPCRLKDIKDLILDTGLSSDGYSIIPQGKVEFVVSAKPEERRLLFEETAGIAKYKVKREEALRKLERVKLDMARVDDILAYLKEQMASLEQAVKKAKNYQKYKQELQMLECANAVRQIELIESELQQAESLYQELVSQYTPLATEITTKESFIAEVKLKIIELEKEFIKLKDDLALVETQISLSTQKIENYKNEIKKSEDSIEKFNFEIKDLEERNKLYSDEIKELENKKILLEENISSFANKKEIYQKEYDNFRNQINTNQELVKQKNKQLSEIVYDRVRVRNEVAAISKESQRLYLELNSITKDLESTEREKKLSEEELKKIINLLEDLNNQKIQINDRISNISNEIKDLEKLLEQKRVINEEKNKEFYTLTTKFDNIDTSLAPFGIKINKIIKFLEEKGMMELCKPVSSIIKLPPENYSMISSYLGNRLLWFVVDKEEDAIRIIDMLKEKSLGYATFIIREKLDSIDEHFVDIDEKILKILNYEPKYSKIVNFLFSKTKVDNDILKTDFVIHGGKYEIKDEPEDLYHLECKINDVSKEIKFLNEEIQNLTLKCQNLIEEKNLLEREEISLQAQIKQLQNTKEEKASYINSLIELQKVLENNFKNVKNQLDEFEKQTSELNNQIKELDKEEKKLREEINNLISEISQIQSNKVVEEYMNITSEYTRFEEQHNNILSEIKTKNSLINTNFQKIESLKNEIEYIENYIQKIQREISNEEENLEQLLARKEELSKKIAELTSKIEQEKVLLDDTEGKIRELINQKDMLQQKINNIEIQKSTLMNNKSNYINWLNEKYNVPLNEAKEIYGNIKEVDQQQIEKLKKRLDSMGAINLAAPEEYAQLEEKYNLLITQQQDLLKSQQDLKDAITKINQQISTNFKEIFQKVRENFINLCKILFEGGNAELLLTDENNILESGIEIIVQPPGKKHQNINLLSGGEKSLVAFALLFAFFVVKPSPVCILDEADAQLDEINVVRFMKLLKEFSKDTKFILITHNTRTMEFLNTLYGVTMEELGISKVIAIKLQKAEVAV